MSKSRYEIVSDEQPKKRRYELVSEKNEAKVQPAASGKKGKPTPEELKEFSEMGLYRPFNRAAMDVVDLLGNVAGSVAEGVPAAVSQGIDDPWRLIRNLAAGGAGIPAQAANTVLNIPAYMEHLVNRSGKSELIKPYTPQIDVNKYQQKWVGGEETPEDVAIRQMVGVMPIAAPGLKFAGKAGLQGVQKITGKANPLLEAERVKNNLAQEATESELSQANMAHTEQAEQTKAAQSQAMREVNLANPDKMEFKLNEQAKKIDELNEQSKNINSELKSLEEPEKAPEKGKESALKMQEKSDLLKSYDNNLAKAEKHYEDVKNIANESDADIKYYLNYEGAHDVDISAALTHRFKSIEDYWQTRYSNFVDKIKDVNFQMPETALSGLKYSRMSPTELVKTYGAEAFEAIKKGKLEDFVKKKQKQEIPQNKFEEKLISLAPNVNDVSAANFLLKRKAFREELLNLQRNKRNNKYNALEEEEVNKAINKGKEMRGQIEEALENGLGDFKPEFDEINQGYSKQVYPLRDNPLMQRAEEGKLSTNVMREARTNEEGMPLVRELIKQEPEILRNVIGQRLKASPDEVYHPNALMREYLNENPQLQKMIDNRNEAYKLSDASKAQINNIKRKITDAKAQHKVSEKEHKAYEAEFNKLLKEHNKKYNEHIKNKDELSKKIADHESEIKTLEEKNTKLNEHIKKIREEFNRQNLTLKKKNELGVKLKELKKESSELDKKIVGTKGYLRRSYYLAKSLYRVAKKMQGL